MNTRASGLATAITMFAVGVAACDSGTRSEVSRNTKAAVETARDVVSDSRITTTVQGKYFASREVKGHEIDVDTKQGVVTLTGEVASENARQQAVQIARGVAGVSLVEDRLTIRPDADRGAPRPAGEPERSPGWITTKIQAQYYLHPGLKPWDIDVTTSQAGVVTLAGEIDSEADRAEAVKIASATEGVTHVEDRLRRKAEVAATATGSLERNADRAGDLAADGWITAKVQARYFLDGEVKGRNIDVDTHDGIVTLQGTVNSHSEHNQAVAMARNTDGVREVRDQLQMVPEDRDVRGTAGREASKVGRETRRVGEQAGRKARQVGQRVDDAWITAKIQAKYFTASNIKSRKIDVDTRDGVVTLQGAVGTSAAREMAANLARETDGVATVRNQLKIDPSLQ